MERQVDAGPSAGEASRPAMPATMRAITQRSYGDSDVLRLEQLPVPTPGPDQVVVRVHAAAVSRGDVHLMTGKPYVIRALFGVRRPRDPVVGQEVAGSLVAVGPDVTAFAVGDAVFGPIGTGAFAEYACAPVAKLARKPAELSFAEAAAVGDSAMTALQGLRDVGGTKPGDRVLINGASGGVGLFAVQIAKVLGAEVTAVCSTRHVDAVRAAGADHVIDYTREDFTRREAGAPPFDVMLDLVGNRSLRDCKRVLAKRGVFVSSAGSPTGGNWIGPFVWMFGVVLANWSSSQTLRSFIVRPEPRDLATLAEWAATGRVRPVLEHTFPLEQTPQAIAHVQAGHARGKTVVTVVDGTEEPRS